MDPLAQTFMLDAPVHNTGVDLWFTAKGTTGALVQVQGQISNLREQVKYLLIPVARDADGKCIERACHYVADFVYDDERGNPVVEDCKGVRTDAYVIKRKLMYLVHGHKIKET